MALTVLQWALRKKYEHLTGEEIDNIIRDMSDLEREIMLGSTGRLTDEELEREIDEKSYL